MIFVSFPSEAKAEAEAVAEAEAKIVAEVLAYFTFQPQLVSMVTTLHIAVIIVIAHHNWSRVFRVWMTIGNGHHHLQVEQ